jgi:ELWxxDGT repeat protein
VQQSCDSGLVEGRSANGNLWKTDGTTAGTVLVSSVNIQETFFVVAGSFAYFAGNDGRNGLELWRSDGTTAGTVMLTDNPGKTQGVPNGTFTSSNPYAHLSVVNGRVFFAGTRATTGDELWTSDGTPAGTVPIQDLNPGAAGSSPGDFVGVNGTILFVAADAAHGPALWRLDQVNPRLAGSSAAAKSGTKLPRLTDSQLRAIVAAAVDRWAAVGLDANHLGIMRTATFAIADLGGSYLGLADAATHGIHIDDDAAGYGWFVDTTPGEDSEFRRPGDSRVRGRMDLLSVVAHQLGNLAGLDDDHDAGHAGDVMGDSLTVGTRRMPSVGDTADVTTADLEHLDCVTRGRPVRRR